MKFLTKLLVLSWSSFPLFAHAQQDVTSSPTHRSLAVSKTNEERAHQNYLLAKKLIVDGLPDDRDRIESLLLDAIRIAPQQPEAYAELSRYTLWQISNALLDPTQIYKASELATIVKDLSADRPLGDYLICEILLAAGQYQQALKVFTEAKSKYPTHVDTYVFEARFWSDIEPERALKAAQEALALGHPMDDLSPAIAEAILKASGSESAGDNLARFAQVYPDRWLWHRAALAYVEEKNLQKGRDAYEKAIHLGNELESRLQLGVLAYTEMKDATTAVHQLSKLKEQIYQRQNARNESIALITGHLAVALLDAGRLEESIAEADEALMLALQNATVLNAIVDEFQKRGHDDKLVKSLSEIAKQNPLSDATHIILGNISAKQKQFRAAVEHFSNALVLRPERDDLYSARGHARYALFDYAAALGDFEAAVKYRPDSASHHYNKACMLALLGRKTEALQDLKEAILLNKEFRVLASRDADLETLRADQLFLSELTLLGVVDSPDDGLETQ